CSRLRAVSCSRLAWAVSPRRAEQASHLGLDATALAVAFNCRVVGSGRIDPRANALEQDRARSHAAAKRRVFSNQVEGAHRRSGKARRTSADTDRRYI